MGTVGDGHRPASMRGHRLTHQNWRVGTAAAVSFLFLVAGCSKAYGPALPPPTTLGPLPADPFAASHDTVVNNVKLYVKKNFSSNTLFAHITDIYNEEGMTVRTDLGIDGADASSRATAIQICQAIPSQLLDSKYGGGIAVISRTGLLLADRSSPADACRAEN